MSGMPIQLSPASPAGMPMPLGAAGVGATAPGVTLLPAAPTDFDVGDALTEIMKLTSALTEEQTKGAKSRADSASNARTLASEKRMQAINDAIEAARKAAEAKSSGGLFDFISDNLGPAGLLGLCTGAAYIVAADLALHATGISNNKLDLADAAGVGAMMAGPIGVAAYAAELLCKKYGPEELQKTLDQGPTISDKDTRLANKLLLTVTEAQLALVE